MLKTSCKQFTFKHFQLEHDNPALFATSQWQCDKTQTNIKYCLYRVSTFIIFFVSWIFTYVKETPAGKPRWPIYLTNWGFTLCMVQALIGSTMLIVSLLAERNGTLSGYKNKVMRAYKTYWLINVIATPVAFTISIIYWTLIFKAEGGVFGPMNFVVHGLNSILMIVDLWIVAQPVRIFHFIYPLLLALTYTIFTIIFYLFGGTTKTGARYIYPILKWDQPGKTTGVCAGVMVLMIVLHIGSYVIYRVRLKIFHKFFARHIEKPLPCKEHGSPHIYVNNSMASDYI